MASLKQLALISEPDVDIIWKSKDDDAEALAETYRLRWRRVGVVTSIFFVCVGLALTTTQSHTLDWPWILAAGGAYSVSAVIGGRVYRRWSPWG